MILSVIILLLSKISALQTRHPPFGTYPPTSFSNSFYSPSDYYYSKKFKQFKQEILLPIQRPALGILAENLRCFNRNKIYANPTPINFLERKSSKTSSKSYFKPFTSFNSVIRSKSKQPKTNKKTEVFNFKPHSLDLIPVFPLRNLRHKINIPKRKHQQTRKVNSGFYNLHYDVSDSHSGTAFDAQVNLYLLTTIIAFM